MNVGTTPLASERSMSDEGTAGNRIDDCGAGTELITNRLGDSGLE